MKHTLLLFISLLCTTFCIGQHAPGLSENKPAGIKQQALVKHASPRQMFPGLFEAVQSNHIFADSKTFADATPLASPAEIIKACRENSLKYAFNLKTFVTKYFAIPTAASALYKTDSTQTVEAHIENLWSVLQRNADATDNAGSLIPLPHPYIVPGGRFREVYYWDSYFTMLGLREIGRFTLMENILQNFAYLIHTYGFIPNGNRTYYLTRSQPPFFACMVQLLMESRPAEQQTILATYRDALEKEYHFWMKGSEKNTTTLQVVRMPDGTLLNRYRDQGNWPREESWTEDIKTAQASGRLPLSDVYRELRSGAASGWDYSSRWLADGKTLGSIHVTDIVPVDLNCLLYNLETLLAAAYEGNATKATFYRNAATRRKNAMQKYCWDAKQGWFYDYDFKTAQHTNSLNLAGAFPLFFGIARQGQADSCAQIIHSQFLQPGGLVTTPLHTGQQWDAPNGWAPLQWITIAGLRRYQEDTLANTIARRWIALNEKTFKQTGKLLEKYNVMDTTLTGGGGEYPNQDGFGWTNGVLLKLLHTYTQK